MTQLLLFLLLVAVIAVNIQLKEILKLMPNLQERLDQINTDLNEAADEIITELTNLRGMTLPPEAEASLAAIEAKANALKNISPPIP